MLVLILLLLLFPGVTHREVRLTFWDVIKLEALWVLSFLILHPCFCSFLRNNIPMPFPVRRAQPKAHTSAQ